MHLTPREKEVLLWAARGKTSWETAKLLGLSEATVNQHLRNTMAKLDASNRVQVSVRCLRSDVGSYGVLKMCPMLVDILRRFMAGKKCQKKRFWSDEEKRSICAQASVPGISIAQVARRYSMNTNLIHKWLKDPRFAPEASEDAVIDEGTGFLPVEIEGVARSLSSARPSALEPALHTALSAARVDITLSDGRRILVEGTTALSAVLALVEGLMP